MGEAIARFREMAHAIRCMSDAAFVAPDYLMLGPEYVTRSLRYRLPTGKVPSTEFARLLRAHARSGPGIKGSPPAAAVGNGEREDFNAYFDSERKPILAKAPSKGSLDKQHAAALREAVEWGALLSSIERRLTTLSEATLAMREMAADSWSSRFSRTKERYAKTLLGWQKAFDALAPFVDEPSAAAGLAAKQKTSSRHKQSRAGGRKPKWSAEKKQQILLDREAHKKKMSRRNKPPQQLKLWRREWATDHGMKVADASLLWQAARRDEYR